jgi:hypothetical protein
MNNDLVIATLTNKLGDVAHRLYQLGHEYKLAHKSHESKVMLGIAGEIWATLTKCEVVYDDITYEKDKAGPGFIK